MSEQRKTKKMIDHLIKNIIFKCTKLILYITNTIVEQIADNLPLIEIQNLNLLGNIISYIQVSKEIVQIKENELPIELEQPKPLVKKEEKEENADGEVVDNEAKEVVSFAWGIPQFQVLSP